MKNLFTLLITVSFLPFFATAQNVGVDVATPQQKLDVDGGIKIGNTANGVAGSLRWDGTNIQYHDGTSWVNLVANTDDQNLTLALNILSIEDGNTVDLSPYLDNTDAQTLSLSGEDLTISTGNTVDLGPLQRQLVDADSDTKVQVEESADEDIIRFDLAGNERWVMQGARLENSGTGNSVFIGENSGVNDDLSNRRNTAVGSDALRVNSTGIGNTAMGYQALENQTSSYSSAIGHHALLQSTGIRNTAVGALAGQNMLSGTDNVFIGVGAGSGFSSSNENTMLGNYAGFNSLGGGSGNVFIGYRAGYNETGSDKLYIDNSDIANPLIQGDFSANTLQFNGAVNVGGNYTLPTADGTSGYVMSTDGSGTVSWVDPGLTGDITAVNAGDGLVGGGTSGDVTLDINPDNSTVEVAADVLRVKAEGITTNEIATDGVDADEIAADAVGLSEIATGGVASAEIVDNSIDAIDINTGAVATDEILNSTILPEDVDPTAGSDQQVLSIVGGAVTWSDPGAVTPAIQDDDGDTKIEVEASADEDFIRMSTQGAEELTINPAGNVGIGITDPTRPVHVAGANGGQILVSRDDATVTVGETLGEILFDAEDDNASTVDASAVIRAVSGEPTAYGNSDKGGELTFLTKANATDENAAATEHMRITQDGKIAVGTTTANSGAKMTVSNGDDSYSFYGPNATWAGGLYVGAGTNTVSAGNAQVISTNGNLHLDPGVGNQTYINWYQAGHTFINGNGGNVGIGTTNPTFKLHVPSGYIGADYINTTDNSVGSGVTGIMIKAGDNYLRTGTASAVATFLDATGTWIPNNGSGNYQIASNSNATNYTAASLELRETNFSGAGQQPPRLSFHWGGVVASQLSVENSGRIVVRNNPGTGYENFAARDVTATSNSIAQGHFYGRYVNGQYSNIYRMGGVYFTWDSDSYGTNTHHSIRSTYGDGYGDNLTMNSFNHIRFNVDANSNNGTSYFEVGDNTTGTGNIMFRLQTGGDISLNGKLAFRSNDSWLRFNQNGNFTSGTYTPGFLRVDGGFASGGTGNPGAGNIRATSLAGGGNTVVLADNNGTLYDVGNLVGTGLGDNLGNHVATTTLNMNYNNVMIKPNVTANSGNIGLDWHGGSTAYKIYQEAGGWSYPYPDLMIRFHTGIKLSAESNYGGVRIYANSGESQTAGFNNNGLTMYRDINLQGNDVWSVNDMTVQTIYDNGGDIVHFDQQNSSLFRVRFDVGANNDVWMDRWDGNHPMIRPGLNGRGFNGKFNSYWYETYTLRIWRNQEYFFSDSRVKENIRQLDGRTSLDKILSLNGKQYDLNRDVHPQLGPDQDLEEHVWKDNLGFIAQELKEVVPEMVVLDKNTGYYAVKNYEQLFPIMIEAMKEQQKQIEILKHGAPSSDVDQLKAEIKELRSLIEKMTEQK